MAISLPFLDHQIISSSTMQDNVQRKTKRRRESWIRATEFPVSGREEGISMVAAFSEVVVASPILFTRHGCRHSSKGIRSRLETCLPSWGTMRWVSAGYSFEHLLPRNPVKFMIDYHERLNLLLLPLFESLSTPNSSLIERISPRLPLSAGENFIDADTSIEYRA